MEHQRKARQGEENRLRKKARSLRKAEQMPRKIIRGWNYRHSHLMWGIGIGRTIPCRRSSTGKRLAF